MLDFMFRRDVIESLAETLAIIVVDMDIGEIISTNASLDTMFGYMRGELNGCCVDILIPLKSRVIHATDRAEYAQTPTVRLMGERRELLGCRKDGGEFPVEIALNPTVIQKCRVVIGVVLDTSKRRVSEKS